MFAIICYSNNKKLIFHPWIRQKMFYWNMSSRHLSQAGVQKIKIKMQFLSRIFRMAFHLDCLHSFYFSYWRKVQSINLAKQDVTADVEKRENKGYRSWDCKEVKSDEARHDE